MGCLNLTAISVDRKLGTEIAVSAHAQWKYPPKYW